MLCQIKTDWGNVPKAELFKDSAVGLRKRRNIVITAPACELHKRKGISRGQYKNTAFHHVWLYCFHVIQKYSDKVCLFLKNAPSPEKLQHL